MSALKADAPQRLAEHFIALPAMKFMQEILEIAGRRLFVPLQSKECGELFFGHDVSLGLMEFGQKILQLAMCVKEPGTNRALGDAEDFRDLGVRHSLDVKHGDDGTVVVGQLLHGLVQPFLQLAQVCVAHRRARRGEFDELLVVLHVRVDVIEAKREAAAALFQKIDRHVHADGVDPGVER